MTAEREKVKELYLMYGFQCIQEQNGFDVFTRDDGSYFMNMEIMKYDHDASTDAVAAEYDEKGYSVRCKNFVSIEKVHDVLFRGFFKIDRVRSDLNKDYISFCDVQSENLRYDDDVSVKYEYVEPNFYWNKSRFGNGLVDKIVAQLFKDGPQLIILEAAAGYGKTCSSYEILHSIVNHHNVYGVPIFIELSKNRNARVFQYVLLEEINRKFLGLSYDTVVAEIKRGVVPLIIDGFDELLSRKKEANEATNEDEAQSMLDTIADLFKDSENTRVILTSRKSAIFTGETFDKWVTSKVPNCDVSRISIEEPTIYDWLQGEKYSILEKQKIPFASIVNPILLSFMRNISVEQFRKICSSVESVLTYYFEKILRRERHRQELELSPSEQLSILKRLAKDFVILDIDAAEPQDIKSFLLDYITDDFEIEYSDRYWNAVNKPSLDEFADKIAHHALLNRKQPGRNEVSFINDLVFGLFIGESFIEDRELIKDATNKHIVLASTAFSGRDDDKKERLFSVIGPYLSNMMPAQKLSIEISLISTIQADYKNAYISNFTFGPDVQFEGIYCFEGCVFRNCTFNSCIIATEAFKNCQFLDCRFYDVEIVRNTQDDCALVFDQDCIGHEEWQRLSKYIPEEKKEEEVNYRLEILKQFYSPNKKGRYTKLNEAFLLRNTSNDVKYEEALEELRRDEFLYKDGHYWIFNRDKFLEVKAMMLE